MRLSPVSLGAMFVLAACGSSRQSDTQVAALRAQLTEVQVAQAKLRGDLERANHRIVLLHDRVETVRTQQARDAMPPKLDIIKLKPEKAPANHATDPGKLIQNYPPDVEEEAFVAPPASIVKSAPASGGGAVSLETTPEDEDLYKSGFEHLQKKEYSEALVAFDQFLKKNPNHDHADNALYWSGECYYDQGEHMLAIEEFRKVPELYPTGNKVPDALLKIGFAYAAIGNKAEARRTLSQLVDAYPASEASKKARVRLRELGG